MNFPTPQTPNTMRRKAESPRPSEEVDLCLAAIRKIFKYVDGLGEWDILIDAMDCLEIAYKMQEDRVPESNLLSSLRTSVASSNREQDQPPQNDGPR